MNTEKIIDRPVTGLEKYDPKQIQANAPASWSQVKYWSETAAKGAMVSAAAMVMAGFALADLRKKFHGPGKRTDLCDTTSPHDAARLGWQEAVEKYAGVSDDTARRWIATAEGVKSKWKKNPPQERIRELMHHPVSDWSEADTELVFKSLAKAIDGATMVEFMRELGLAKKAQGAGATGRLPNCDNSNKKLSLSEEAALRKTQAIADWQANWKQLTAYGEKFIFLPDDLVTAQVATLEQALKARKEWLKQPANKRDAKAIADMVKFNPDDDKQFRAALDQLAPEETLAPEVKAHKPFALPNGNTILVTGFAHDKRRPNGDEPFEVIFNDNTDKRRVRQFSNQAAAEDKLGIRIKF